MNPLLSIIRAQIERFGPLSIAEYMTLCLLHPEHGYYTSRAPLGRAGDFITAPEISQMFGELIGLALAQAWMDQGRPDPFVLAELGPGRGTLMADALRATQAVPGFHAAVDIWLVEASPALQQEQAALLKGHRVTWCSSLSDLPEAPLFLIANEFFDALPIRQFQKTKSGWQERMIGCDDTGLVFGLGRGVPDGILDALPDGDFVEICNPARDMVGDIAQRIRAHGGLAMIIDYGNWGSAGTTFQAVKAHQKVDPLCDPGLCDLTAHVDFRALAEAAKGVALTALSEQGVLLERLGITQRAQGLARNLTGPALENHIAAHRRLTHPEEMGSLFKALALYPADAPPPPGFE